MMRLIHKQELESIRVKFIDPLPRSDALHGSNSDISHTSGMILAQLDLDPFLRICKLAVAICLIY